MTAPHGNANRYKAGCRCDDCRRANTEAHRRLKGRKPSRHGTVSGYVNYGCRCAPCRAAGKSENARAREKFREGDWVGSHGTAQRYTLSGCRCDLCMDWKMKYEAARRDKQDRSRESAVRNGLQWTGPEIETALERGPDGQYLRSAMEVSVITGRTVYAVGRMRARASDPRVGGMV